MASYFAKMIFFKNQQRDTGCTKSQKCCYSQETFVLTYFITQYTIQDKNDRFWSSFSSMEAKNTTCTGCPTVKFDNLAVKS